MKLGTIDVIILLLLGVLCIARATWGIFKDIDINLSTAKSVTGQVAYSNIIQIDKATFKSKKHKTVFAIELQNSNVKFAVDRGIDVCKYLDTQIKPGDTIRVFYRLGTNEYNTFVFQIEKGQKTLANISDYKEGETKMIVLLYAFGFVIFGGLLAWYRYRKEHAELAQP